MANDSMGNLEKLGILVIVILVVVVGVVAITPSETLFDADPEPAKLEDGLRDGEFAPSPDTLPSGLEANTAWPDLSDPDPLAEWLVKGETETVEIGETRQTADLPDAVPHRSGGAPLPPPTNTNGTDRAQRRHVGSTPIALRPVPPATVTRQPAHPAVRPAAVPAFSEYVIRDGDTLSGIAKRLTPGRSWTHIARANPDIDPNLIKANTVLRIPVAAANVAVPTVHGSGARTIPVIRPVTPPVTPDGGITTYVVRKGDSLSRIAAHTLGSGNHWRKVFDANRNLLSDPNHVREGMTLRIPSTSRPSTGTTLTPLPKFGVVGREGDQTYVVRGGDTLSGIAQRFLGSAARWREILDLNRDQVPTPEKLRSGITIRLP